MGGTKGQLFLAYYKNIVLVREAIRALKIIIFVTGGGNRSRRLGCGQVRTSHPPHPLSHLHVHLADGTRGVLLHEGEPMHPQLHSASKNK